MGVFWSDESRLLERIEEVRRELRLTEMRYQCLLNKLAPLPYKKDGTLNIYEVVWDEGGSYGTEDQERPQREIRAPDLRELQHKVAGSGKQIINLARFIVVHSDTSSGTVRYVCCDLLD